MDLSFLPAVNATLNGIAAVLIVIGLVLACFIGPLIIEVTWGYNYQAQNLEYGPRPPSL